MRASVFVASAFAAVAFAQDSSSINPAPQTTLTTQTDSRGVVTGQPTQPGQPAQVTDQPGLVTSQPAADTSVGSAVTIPAVGTSGIVTVTLGNPDNSTSTLTVSVNNSTTSVMKPTLTPTGSDATGSGGSANPTGTGADGKPTASGSGAAGSASGNGAAAATMRAVAGSLVGAGAFVAAFL